MDFRAKYTARWLDVGKKIIYGVNRSIFAQALGWIWQYEFGAGHITTLSTLNISDTIEIQRGLLIPRFTVSRTAMKPKTFIVWRDAGSNRHHQAILEDDKGHMGCCDVAMGATPRRTGD